MAHSFDRGGDRNYAALPQAGKDAHDFVDWATEQGARRDAGPRQGWAAHAARHLRTTDPQRFEKAVAAWKAGHPATYATLMALAEEAAR